MNRHSVAAIGMAAFLLSGGTLGAAVITITWQGTVTEGQDKIAYFSQNPDLAGQRFTARYEVDTTQGTFRSWDGFFDFNGGTQHGNGTVPSPIRLASITINGRTFQFGSREYGGYWRDGTPGRSQIYTEVQQAAGPPLATDILFLTEFRADQSIPFGGYGESLTRTVGDTGRGYFQDISPAGAQQFFGNLRPESVTIAYSQTPSQFLPVAPCRLVDTRNPQGPLGGPAVGALTTRNFPVRSACGLPSNAEAYSLNVTVVPRRQLGYLSIWPFGQGQPLVSTLNSLDGRIKANAALVPAGPDGSINVFVTDLTDVIIDVNGVFVPQGSNSAAQAFYPVTPCRILNTSVAGGGGTLQAQVNRTVIVANTGGCGVPTNATAYATNVTVVPKGPLGFLTLWPNNGSARPVVSTLNALTGTVTANLAIVPAGNASDILAFATDATELIVDVTGYFAPPGGINAMSFYPLLPCRVLDTRNANGPLGGPVQGPVSTRQYPVQSSNCAVPSTARAYSMNATVVPAGLLGFLTLFPTGVSLPVVSTLNAVDASITSNAAIVPAGSGGQISAYVTEQTHLILDINGYFAPVGIVGAQLP